MEKLRDTKKTVLRIAQALKNQEKIALFADDDTDGIVSAVMMFEILQKLGFRKLKIYLAERGSRGHIGLTKNDVLKFKSKNIKLIITLDCGTDDEKDIVLAKKLGIDTIVVDHHLINLRNPKALTFLNPQQIRGSSPLKHFSTAGLVYKLAGALSKYFNKDLAPSSFLDLVAISTIFDRSKIKGGNKLFVDKGKKVLSQTKRIGLKELAKKNTDLEILGRKLNVAPALSLDLLLTVKDKNSAQKLVNKIDRLFHLKNKQIQKSFQSIQETLKFSGKQEFIFIGDKTWPNNIIGCLALKLLKKYQKPIFVYTKIGKYYIGSARAPQKYNLVKIMKKCSPLLLNFGGHAQAAGFTLEPSCLNKFEICLRNVFNK